MLSQNDFQLEVIEALTELRTDMRSVKEHLAKLNGKVAAHERELAERRNGCALVDKLELRVRPVEEFVIAQRATEQISRHWLDRAWPFSYAGSGVVVFIILQHASELIKLIKL